MILHGRRVCFARTPACERLRARGHLSVEQAVPPIAVAGATRSGDTNVLLA